MIYSFDFDILITSGYENVIYLWKIESSIDYVMIGKLEAYNILSTVSLIESSPILISVDINGNIKIWDLILSKCVQTLEIDTMSIEKILAMH